MPAAEHLALVEHWVLPFALAQLIAEPLVDADLWAPPAADHYDVTNRNFANLARFQPAKLDCHDDNDVASFDVDHHDVANRFWNHRQHLLELDELMQRIPCDERADWRDRAKEVGFDFHTINDAPYWDETAYYAFSLQQIEPTSKTPPPNLKACAASWCPARSRTTA